MRRKDETSTLLSGPNVQKMVEGQIMLRGNKPLKHETARKPPGGQAGADSKDDPCIHGLAHMQKKDTVIACGTDGTEHNARAYYVRGLSHEERGEYANAIREYDRAISLDPCLAWAYYHRGIAHGGAGHRRKKVEDLRAAARLGLGIAIDMLTVCDRLHKRPKGAKTSL